MLQATHQFPDLAPEIADVADTHCWSAKTIEIMFLDLVGARDKSDDSTVLPNVKDDRFNSFRWAKMLKKRYIYTHNSQAEQAMRNFALAFKMHYV